MHECSQSPPNADRRCVIGSEMRLSLSNPSPSESVFVPQGINLCPTSRDQRTLQDTAQCSRNVSMDRKDDTCELRSTLHGVCRESDATFLHPEQHGLHVYA
ncbi:hypothetical protein F2P81_008990 [Scophthalmus maximus]|uniref:Uncharacterized protein n=1 Tax=Scophthalmus maximus TaxID=52904 RepID=A0A6A4STF8_SCOMX|nr:hypothetical protein F2P81_008990 [Scophthalmus maximus]